MNRFFRIAIIIAAVLVSMTLAQGCRFEDGRKEANHLYELGLAALDENKRDEAISRFEKAVEKDPGHAKAHCRLGQLYLSMNQRGLAEREFRAALKADPALIKEAKIPLARLLYRRGAYERAIPLLREIMTAQVKDPDIPLILGNALLKTGDVDAGREIMEKAVSQYPNDLSARLALAAFYERAGMTATAEKALHKTRDDFPGSSEPYVALMDFYMHEGRLERAEQTGTAALKQGLFHKDVYHRLFVLQNNRGNQDAALSHLEAAVETSPDDPELWMLLGDYRFFLKRYAKARDAYQRVIGKWPDWSQARARIAEAYMAEGRYDEARSQVEAMIVREPDNARALLLRGLLWIRAGDTEKARKDILRARDIDPGSADGHYFYGLSLLKDKEYALALPEMLQAVGRRPDAIRARLGLAYVYFNIGQFFLAADELDKILAVRPDHRQARAIRAVARVRLKDYERAASDYRYMIDKGLATPEMRFHLVGIYIAQGKLEDALRMVEEELRRNPDSLKALEQQVRIYAAQGAYRKAIEVCDRYLKERPDDLAIGTLKAEMMLKDGKYGKAEELLLPLIKKHPRAYRPVRLMAAVLKRQRNYNQALAYYQKAVDIVPGAIDLHMELAEVYYHVGQFDKAAEAYEAVLRLDSSYGPAANDLAYLYADRDQRLDEALSLSLKAYEVLPESPAVRDTLGWVYLKKGSVLLGKMHLSDAVRLSPETPLFQYHLGVALHASNDLPGAEKALSEAIRLGLVGKELAAARNILEQIKAKGVS